jgi:hypothetical protein
MTRDELEEYAKRLEKRVDRPAVHDLFEDLQRDYFELKDRVKELEALKCSQPGGPSKCPLGPCKCYRCTGTPDADSYYEDAENNSAAGEG